jgi:hypothetical protein
MSDDPSRVRTPTKEDILNMISRSERIYMWVKYGYSSRKGPVMGWVRVLKSIIKPIIRGDPGDTLYSASMNGSDLYIRTGG